MQEQVLMRTQRQRWYRFEVVVSAMAEIVWARERRRGAHLEGFTTVWQVAKPDAISIRRMFFGGVSNVHTTAIPCLHAISCCVPPDPIFDNNQKEDTHIIAHTALSPLTETKQPHVVKPNVFVSPLRTSAFRTLFLFCIHIRRPPTVNFCIVVCPVFDSFRCLCCCANQNHTFSLYNQPIFRISLSLSLPRTQIKIGVSLFFCLHLSSFI